LSSLHREKGGEEKADAAHQREEEVQARAGEARRSLDGGDRRQREAGRQEGRARGQSARVKKCLARARAAEGFFLKPVMGTPDSL
jgi:hypothetical protein